MSQPRSAGLACPACRNTRFEISVLKDEGVAAARCLECDRNYLLLDSGDYWFDVIQQGYPRPGRCGCKGTAFKLRVDYDFRDDGDVRSVDVWSTCAACGKSRRQFGADIDYGPTGHLVDAPLTYCKNPKVLYDLKELTLYAKRTDIARVVRFLHDEGDCQFIACLRENDLWDVRNVDVDHAEQAILKETEFSLRYLWIYATPRSIKVPASAVGGTRKEDVFWKRGEIIRISSPSRMLWGSFGTRPSLLYYIHFSNEYVEDERVISKPQRFRDLTARFVAWLQTEFVTWRGPDCFDNPQEHQRAFGRKYRDSAEKKGRRKS